MVFKYLEVKIFLSFINNNEHINLLLNNGLILSFCEDKTIKVWKYDE